MRGVLRFALTTSLGLSVMMSGTGKMHKWPVHNWDFQDKVTIRLMGREYMW